MSFGLLSGILGGGGLFGGGSNATQSTNTASNTGGNISGGAAAPSNFSVNQFNQALNNAYTAGLNQGASFSQPTFNFVGGQQGGFPGGSQGFQTISNTQNNIANNLVSDINFGGSTQHTHGGFTHAHSGAAPHGHGNISATGNVSHSHGGASHAHGGGSAPHGHGSTTGTTSGGSANTNVFGSGLGGTFDTVDSLESNLLGGGQTDGNVQTSGGQSGGGLLGGLPLVRDLLGGDNSQGGGNGGILGDLLGGGGLGGIVGAPLGLFSNLVGHDSAANAAANGDVMGWLVNTFDHTGHSHALGGNSGGGSGAPLGILGTLGQEAGGLVGLDKVFGSAQVYDANNGTNYAAHGSSNYGLTGDIGLGSLLGGGASSGHGGHSGH